MLESKTVARLGASHHRDNILPEGGVRSRSLLSRKVYLTLGDPGRRRIDGILGFREG